MPRAHPPPTERQLDGWRALDSDPPCVGLEVTEEWLETFQSIGLSADDNRLVSLTEKALLIFDIARDEQEISALRPRRATQRRELLKLMRSAKYGVPVELAHVTECDLADELMAFGKQPTESGLWCDPYAYAVEDQIEAASRIERRLAEHGGQRKNFAHRYVVDQLADIYKEVTGLPVTHFTGKHTSKFDVRDPQSKAGQFILQCVEAANFQMTPQQICSVLEEHVRERNEKNQQGT